MEHRDAGRQGAAGVVDHDGSDAHRMARAVWHGRGCRQAGGTLATASETAALRWATRAEVEDLADPAYAIRVLDALDFATIPAVRAHDGVRLV